ncbi:MAG: carbamoyl-phosphate synthase domain-containing protein, partial [Pontixanthobacter sp.]
MAHAASSSAPPKGATGACVFADGTIIWGMGFGKPGYAVGEVCFNTSITGYQEIMTDPSYAAQIVTFTFPHIGNVGANVEDVESAVESAVGCIVREPVSLASSFRSTQEFAAWMEASGKIGLSGVDTRALTRRIRMSGAPNAVIAYEPNGGFDVEGLIENAREWSGLEGLDLASRVSRKKAEAWNGGEWRLGRGYGLNAENSVHPEPVGSAADAQGQRSSLTSDPAQKEKGGPSTGSGRTDT